MLVIESDGAVEVYDAADLVARADRLVVMINEKNFSEWYGTMSPTGSLGDAETLSRLQDCVLTVAFRHKNKRYSGLIRIAPASGRPGQDSPVAFQGIDLLRMV